MNNKRNSLFKLMTSIVLVAVLCLGVAFPALAAPAKPYSEGDLNQPAQAAITKILKIPTGTEIPTLTFKFEFTAIDLDGDPAATMPGIPDVTINYPPTQNDKTLTETSSYGGTKYVAISSGDFIGSTFANGPEGIYKYLVKETGGTNSLTDPTKEGIFYSEAQYYIEVYVEYDDKSGTYFVKYVNGLVIKQWTDEWYDDDNFDDEYKLNPDPNGKHEISGQDTIGDDFSQLVFTNRYWKTTGGGEQDPTKSAFSIKKLVTGNNADHSQLFDFYITVTTPEAAAGKVSGIYKAFIMDASGPIGNAIIFNSGVTNINPVQLKHDQWLAFVDLEVGAKVEVEEKGHADYRPAYERTFAGTTQYIAPSRGEDWGFPRTSNDPDAGPHFTEEGTGENFNLVTYTNTFRPTAPTGIIVDELPYIILIGAAAAGLILFIALKMRKKGEVEGEPAEQEF